MSVIVSVKGEVQFSDFLKKIRMKCGVNLREYYPCPISVSFQHPQYAGCSDIYTVGELSSDTRYSGSLGNDRSKKSRQWDGQQTQSSCKKITFKLKLFLPNDGLTMGFFCFLWRLPGLSCVIEDSLTEGYSWLYNLWILMLTWDLPGVLSGP